MRESLTQAQIISVAQAISVRWFAQAIFVSKRCKALEINEI